MIAWVIPDLNLANLSLWLVDLDAGPVVFTSFRATISTILESELILGIEYFIDSDQVVIVVELVNGWEVSVLLVALDWHVRIGLFVHELGALSREYILSTNREEQCLFCPIEAFLLMLNGLVLPVCISS